MQRIDKEGLMRLLEEWNAVFSVENFSLKLIAVGGTALTLLNLKASTKDIDFTLPAGEDLKKFEYFFNKLKLKHDDEQDVKAILENKKIELSKLKERFKQIDDLTLDRNMKYHFKRLLEVLLPVWKGKK